MDNTCGTCKQCQHQACTQRVPIFSTLDPSELDKVSGLIIRRSFYKGEMIIMEKSRPESLIIINKGQVKAFRYTQEGKEQILYIFSEGDFFGEKNLLKDQEATYNVEALEETHICLIKKKDFQELLREHPEIGMKIIDVLCDRLQRLENAVQNMGTKSMESRVSAVLLEFAGKYGKACEDGLLVELPFSREGIANYIGVARETVSRELSNLQEGGIIEMRGNKKILILDREALESLIQ